MKVNFNKLAGAGMKACGAVASGIGALFLLGSEQNDNNGVLAVGAGLGTSAVILGGQAITDVVSAFSQQDSEK